MQDQILSGEIREEFSNLSDLILDETCPIATTAAMRAASVTGKVATPDKFGQAKQTGNMQGMKELRDLAVKVAHKIGITIDNAHIEDLLAFSDTEKMIFSERDIYMYFKGVAMANQLSVTNKLSNIVNHLETLVLKSNQCIQANNDTNKLMAEKLVLIETKIDNIIPGVVSVVRDENLQIRNAILTMTSARGKEVATSSEKEKDKGIEKALSSSSALKMPSEPDVRNMCLTMDLPDDKAIKAASKFMDW